MGNTLVMPMEHEKRGEQVQPTSGNAGQRIRGRGGGCLVPTAPMAKIDNDHAQHKPHKLYTQTSVRVMAWTGGVDPQPQGSGNDVMVTLYPSCTIFAVRLWPTSEFCTLTFCADTPALPAPCR